MPLVVFPLLPLVMSGILQVNPALFLIPLIVFAGLFSGAAAFFDR